MHGAVHAWRAGREEPPRGWTVSGVACVCRGRGVARVDHLPLQGDHFGGRGRHEQ